MNSVNIKQLMRVPLPDLPPLMSGRGFRQATQRIGFFGKPRPSASLEAIADALDEYAKKRHAYAARSWEIPPEAHRSMLEYLISLRQHAESAHAAFLQVVRAVDLRNSALVARGKNPDVERDRIGRAVRELVEGLSRNVERLNTVVNRIRERERSFIEYVCSGAAEPSEGLPQ
jgi:hypothetical protein